MSKPTRFVAVVINDWTIKLLNPREVYGHDDSIPYNAEFEIYHETEKVVSGKVWNDGWGGQSNYKFDDKTIEEFNTMQSIFDQVDTICKENVKTTYHTMELTFGVVEVMDILAEIGLHPKNKPNCTFTANAISKMLA